MHLLLLVTLLWAFSFSLIGVYLAGQVDSYFSVLTRIVLAALVFLPFIKWRQVQPKLALQLMAIGAIQLGLMYVFYYHSFLLLTVPEVLIFTIFTPIYITLIYDLLKGRFSPYFLFTAVLAVIGAAIIRYDAITDDYLLGFAVVQGANLCFAIGQVGYKVLMENHGEAVNQRSTFGFFYLGALAVALLLWAVKGGEQYPTTLTQWGVLVWLGAVASGLGYFLWNRGATMVSSGQLAVMNNLLIPAGLIVNLLIWNRQADLTALAIGGGIIVLSMVLNQRWLQQRTQ
ncbi:DMT family transporter [Ferrimonas senticii]|uniref:DMT family transporter n=1 Tax=Ferrimonas senticii TaxID=394566 RepID=UPI0004889187|nr:DMT family transporter [Ferrimonas senticii]